MHNLFMLLSLVLVRKGSEIIDNNYSGDNTCVTSVYFRQHVVQQVYVTLVTD